MKEEKSFEKMAMIFLEGALFILLFILIFPFSKVYAEVGKNATVKTYIEVGKSLPNILEIDIEGGSVVLVPNSTRIVNCTAEIEDFDTIADIKNVSAEFFDNSASYLGDSDSGNKHYTNSSCYVDDSYGDEYTALAHCLFSVSYYANADEWNCTVYVEDYSAYSDEKTNLSQIEPLLAVGLPDQIDYGTVNATYVSYEQVANVTNFGNIKINLSLSGYARTAGDGLAMNCSLGQIGDIPVEYEKYNLTQSTSGDLSLFDFEANYNNLTSNAVIKRFDLDYKKDDSADLALNSTYWRIYVPVGVAGTCQGNLIFGAVVGEE